MIDLKKIAIPAACEIGLLIVYLQQHDMIRISDSMDITELISKTFINVIKAYNAMEDKND